MKVLVIGHSSYDISCPVDEYPKENTKYRLDEVYTCGGGPAGNAAFLLGKWGVETYYAGVVGSDDFGNKIKKEFENIGVHTEYLETNYEKPTSISFVMINKQNGSRTLFNIAGERPNLKKYEFTIDPDIILIDGHEYSASIAALNKYPNAISIIDAGRITPELLELCKMTKYVVTSKGFAETVAKMKFDFTNPNTLVQIYSAVKNKFPKAEIVITLEDKGCLYAVNNEIKIMPGLKTSAVDTTGAGDIFHGAFTYAISKGFDLEKCVRYANITAGLSIQKIGARLSIPSITEVSNYYNEKFPQAGMQQSNVAPNTANNTPQQTSPAVEQPNIAPSPAQETNQTQVAQNIPSQNIAPQINNQPVMQQVNQVQQQPVIDHQQGTVSYAQAMQQQANVTGNNNG